MKLKFNMKVEVVGYGGILQPKIRKMFLKILKNVFEDFNPKTEINFI